MVVGIDLCTRGGCELGLNEADVVFLHCSHASTILRNHVTAFGDANLQGDRSRSIKLILKFWCITLYTCRRWIKFHLLNPDFCLSFAFVHMVHTKRWWMGKWLSLCLAFFAYETRRSSKKDDIGSIGLKNQALRCADGTRSWKWFVSIVYVS